MKSLGDAIAQRNRLIEHLEEADTECAGNERGQLLTFVFAGGGFAGVETIGSINDFLKGALPYYPNLKPGDGAHSVSSSRGSSFFPNLVKNLAAILAGCSPSAAWKTPNLENSLNVLSGLCASRTGDCNPIVPERRAGKLTFVDWRYPKGQLKKNSKYDGLRILT